MKPAQRRVPFRSTRRRTDVLRDPARIAGLMMSFDRAELVNSVDASACPTCPHRATYWYRSNRHGATKNWPKPSPFERDARIAYSLGGSRTQRPLTTTSNVGSCKTVCTLANLKPFASNIHGVPINADAPRGFGESSSWRRRWSQPILWASDVRAGPIRGAPQCESARAS